MVTTTKSTKALAVILALLVGMVFSFAMTANANAATASQKAAKAADWAVKQANTKGICMGTGEMAHKAGCAVCKTNAKKKGVKYKNTYCSNPFVQAAFAHGAKSAIMKKDCQNGKSGPIKVSDFKSHKCFNVLSNKPAKSSLKKGDVLIFKDAQGCSIFVGNGKYVSITPGWGDNSIKVVKLSSDRYKDVKSVARYNGK